MQVIFQIIIYLPVIFDISNYNLIASHISQCLSKLWGKFQPMYRVIDCWTFLCWFWNISGLLGNFSGLLGRFEWKFRQVVFWANFCDCWLGYLLWNHSQINVIGPRWRLVSIGSGNSLVPTGSKPLHEPMLTNCQLELHPQEQTSVKF